jgi:hypothetical protein
VVETVVSDLYEKLKPGALASGMREATCACGRVWLTRSAGNTCPPCRGVVAEVIVPLLDPDHDEKTEPSSWDELVLDEEGFPF